MANSIRLNHEALGKILKGQTGSVVSRLESAGQQVMDATGKPDDYEMETWVGRSRARVSIRPATRAASAAEARDHILLRALGSISG